MKSNLIFLAVATLLLCGSLSQGQSLTVSVTSASLPPSASPQPFSLDVSLTNNSTTTPFTLEGWAIRLKSTPAAASGQIKWQSLTSGLGSTTTNPALPAFVFTSSTDVRAIGFLSPGISIPASGSVLLGKLNFELAPNAIHALYSLSFVAGIANTDVNETITPTFSGGTIATPEPSSIVSVLLTLPILAQRRRRTGK